MERKMKIPTGLSDDYAYASDAVGELDAFGVSSADITLVANNSADWYDGEPSDVADDAAGGAGIGAAIGGAGGLLTGLGIMTIPGTGPVVAAGWLVATAAGAVAAPQLGSGRRDDGRAHRIRGARAGCSRLRRRHQTRRNTCDCQCPG